MLLPVGYEKLESSLTGLAPVTDGEWVCKCPAHDDHKPSLWIKDRGGKLVIACRAGCKSPEILAALNLTWGDLFVEDRPKQARKIVEVYDYTDEAGKLLFQSVRFEPKDFAQRRKAMRGDPPENIKNGWVWKGVFERVPKVLYRLPSVIGSHSVILVEGEKDVHAIEGLKLSGCVATCNPMGAGKWEESFTAVLSGKRVCILPDNDEPGRKHAANIEAALKGKAKSVRTVNLPGLPDKGDVSDWLKTHSREEFIEALKTPAVTNNDALVLLAVALSGAPEAAKAGSVLANTLRARGLIT